MSLGNVQHFKIIRDAVHLDIEFDQDEIRIINTREFQRLRRIRQLGLAYLVFPSATHSRFEHVLGVCCMAQKIIDSINRLQPETISMAERKIIRYLALLHDIGHLPFGHTLEDERPTIVEKHDGQERLNHFLFKSSIADEIQRAEREFGLDDARNQLIGILCATKKGGDKKARALKAREKLYADIVGNTICADLLDYLKRDTLFTGIQHRYDERIVSSFRTDTDQLYIDLTDDRSIRTGLVSEILHMLRLRYTLGERVYYHRTKAAASGMLSKAFELLNLQAEDLYDLGDDELLFLMENPAAIESKITKTREVPQELKEAVRGIVAKIRKRALYQPVYRITRSVADEKHQKSHLVEAYHDPKNILKRKQLEDDLIQECELKPGQVIIYCPDAEMSLKEAEVKVRFSSKAPLEILKAVSERNIKDDIAALEEKHKSLWALEVFVDPDIVVARGQRIAAVCQDRLCGLDNDIEAYRASSMEAIAYQSLFQAIERTNKDYSQVPSLIGSMHKVGSSKLNTSDKWIAAFPDKFEKKLL